MHTPFELTQNYQIWRDVVIPMGRGLFLVGQPRPVPRGRSPSAPQIWGSFMRTPHFVAELPNFTQ